MADTNYSVEVVVRCEGRTVDFVKITDEDYGFAMNRLGKWANESEATKDL